MDELTKTNGLTLWSDPPDLQFLYFPGPDNVAHATGGSNVRGESLNSVITGHIKNETDKRFKEIWDKIKEGGYEQATLLVAIADHGLVSTPKPILTEEGVKDLNGTTIAGGTQHLAIVYEGTALTDSSGISKAFTLWRGGKQQDLNDAGIVHAPNGGMAQVYIRGIDPNGPTNSWKFAPSAANVSALAAALYAENTNGTNYAAFKNALAPLSGVKAGVVGLLVKYPSAPPTFNVPYSLFDSSAPLTGLALGTDFSPDGAVADMSWVDVVRRLDQDMNDKAAGRSGDIVLLMNTEAGNVSVLESDILKGWHGAATQTESEVPMRWHFSGSEGLNAEHRSDLLDQIANSLNAVKGADAGSGGRLRSRHFKDGLLNFLNTLPGNVINNP